MLSLSQTSGYAIKALACLSEPDCQSRSITEIAGRTRVPRPYLAKIVNALVRSGLVTARRGIGGGVSLARRPEEITLLQIVEAVEGKNWLGDCLLSLDECSDQSTCPTHDFWQRIRGEITHQLGTTSLAAIIAFRTRVSGKRRRKPRVSRVQV
jgi:Rrf2 family transcriptional regulator, iron-sulfur cluster assembly transcription factor